MTVGDATDPLEPATPEPATPVSAESAPDGAPEATAAPARRRRRWLVPVILVAAVVALLAVGALVADSVARSAARDYVAARVVTLLGLPADADVDVELGSGSILLQLLAGRVDEVSVAVPEARFGDLTGAVQFEARGVPLDAQKPVESLRIGYTVGADALAALGDDAASGFVFVDGEATLSSEFELFGVTIPIGYALEPSADAGELVLTPTRLTIGETVFEPGETDDSIFGAIATALLQPQRLCIADSVPAALTLDSAEIAGDELRLEFEAGAVALGAPELSTPGSCAD